MNTCIIGFFDILGYQSLLENNSGDIASGIIEKLLGIENELPDEIKKSFPPDERENKATKLISMLNWLVFSDTILFYTMFERSDDKVKRNNRWFLVLIACLHLWRRMFQRGLPIRGVVHTGEFIVKGHCFAGRAIVEAYRIAQDYDLSVCAFSKEAFSLMVEDANSMEESFLWRHIPAQLFEYLTPRHSASREEKSMVINPLTLILADQQHFLDGDLTQLVHESFWKHNKDINNRTLTKLGNTERYLRAARARLNEMKGEMKGTTEPMMRFKKPHQD